jgi:hypothetical protein
MTELDVLFPKHGRRDGNRAPMVFAPDGRHFYLLDAQNTLHKIAGDLTEDVSLDTGAACDDLSFSKAGLLVALNSAQAVWVVDPASLEVLREIPVKGLRHVAGSPATPIGFADGTASEDAEPSPRGAAQLSMIDFSKGACLHRIENRFGESGTNGSLVFDARGIFEGLLAMQMTREGKYLYLGGQEIKRFRLQGEDLFFEEASRNPIYGRALRFVISDDGKFAPMPGGGNAAGFALAVLDAMHLDQQLLALDSGANSCVVGFDAKTGNIYSANRKEVDLFSPRGGRLAEIVLKDNDVRRIAVHPGGERFLAWGQKRITYCRFVDDEEKVDKSNHPAQ